MKVDLYTKSILTVVAVCLCIIVVRDISFIPEANAQQLFKSKKKEDTVKVELVNTDVLKVKLVDIEKGAYAAWEAIPIKVGAFSPPIPVVVR